MRGFSFSVLLCLLVGCGSAARDELVPLEEVPENIMDAARQTLPDVTFDQALRRSDGRYEVRGKDNRGKVRDIDISDSGEILEVE